MQGWRTRHAGAGAPAAGLCLALALAVLAPGAAGAEQPEAQAEVDPALAAAERTVLELQARHGALAPELTDALRDLGDRYRGAGELEQALATYRRYWLALRANQGLYSLAQVPALEAIIDVQSRLEEWAAVNDSYALLLWLYRRNHEAGSRALLPALKQVHQWHIEAFAVDTGWALSEHYQAAESLYEEGIALIEQSGGSHREALCFWHEACCDPDTEPARRRGCPRELRAR